MSDCQVQVKREDSWWTLFSEEESFCVGYLCAIRDSPGPRLEYRILNSNGEVVDQTAERKEVSIGMIAGWPTAEQYRSSAERAISIAKSLEWDKTSLPRLLEGQLFRFDSVQDLLSYSFRRFGRSSVKTVNEGDEFLLRVRRNSSGDFESLIVHFEGEGCYAVMLPPEEY